MPGIPIPPGKLPMALLARLLGDLGPQPADVLLGPAVGEDACVLDPRGGVLVAATDPITLTGRDVGRLAVIVNANDVAVTGARPRWFLATILLPVGSTEIEVRDLLAAMKETLAAIGAHLVGGHTEITNAVTQPVVVGQMLGTCERSRFISTAGVGAGERLIQVGPAPVEGAAVLIEEAAGRRGVLTPETARAARAALVDPGISIVEAALAAARLGTTAMHDPTEGGLAAGLHELAAAAAVAIVVDTERVLWFEPGLEVCRALGADPWATLASGCLLASFPQERAGDAVDALSALGLETAVIGRAEEGSGVRDTANQPIAWPERDEVARILSPGLGIPGRS